MPVITLPEYIPEAESLTVRDVVFLMLFILLEAFTILVKCLLVIIQFFGMFFLLAMICGRSVALLCVQADVQLSG